MMKKLFVLLLLFPLVFTFGQGEILDVHVIQLESKARFYDSNTTTNFEKEFITYLKANEDLISLLSKQNLLLEILHFVVNKKGDIQNIVIIYRQNDFVLDNDIKKEIIASIEALPKIKPAEINGKAINSNIIIFFKDLLKTSDSPSEQELLTEFERLKGGATKEKPIQLETFTIVEKMPVFGTCGEQKSDERFATYHKEASSCSKNNIDDFLRSEVARYNTTTQGKVYVRFIIDPNGNLIDESIARSVNEELDNIALEIVSKMQNWQAGSQRGNKVRVQYIIPVIFD